MGLWWFQARKEPRISCRMVGHGGCRLCSVAAALCLPGSTLPLGLLFLANRFFGSGWSGAVVVGLFQQLGQFVSPLEFINAVLSLDGILPGCGRVHLLLLQPSCKSFGAVWLLLDRSTPLTGVFVLGVCHCSGCIYPPSES